MESALPSPAPGKPIPQIATSRIERQLEMLAELAEIGLDLARAVAA